MPSRAVMGLKPDVKAVEVYPVRIRITYLLLHGEHIAPGPEDFVYFAGGEFFERLDFKG